MGLLHAAPPPLLEHRHISISLCPLFCTAHPTGEGLLPSLRLYQCYDSRPESSPHPRALLSPLPPWHPHQTLSRSHLSYPLWVGFTRFAASSSTMIPGTNKVHYLPRPPPAWPHQQSQFDPCPAHTPSPPPPPTPYRWACRSRCLHQRHDPWHQQNPVHASPASCPASPPNSAPPLVLLASPINYVHYLPRPPPAWPHQQSQFDPCPAHTPSPPPPFTPYRWASPRWLSSSPP